MSQGHIYIGTSGWSYKGWAERFYPKDLPAARQFSYYCEHFPTVEINATFYRLPETKTFARWRDQAPAGFLYGVKGSRAVTHYRRLKPGARSFQLLLKRSDTLNEHLGPTLWQLPVGMKKDVGRLEAFLQRLPRRRRHAVEFRDPSWLDEDVIDRLASHRVALVWLSSKQMPMHLEVTADFVYVRFHGLSGGAAHNYTRRELDPWANHLRQCARRGVDCFVYFNNDVNVRAPENALLLMKLTGRAAVGSFCQ
jgi:uncharacterized protein YecE (DUF72 family)